MKFHLGLRSKAKRFFLSSPNKEKTLNGENLNGELGVKSKQVVDSGFMYSDFGSKDETFFDTKAWLDSDCEDDFFSVNGDFTPSRGNTPVHHLSTPRTPQLNKFPDSYSEFSPTSGKKKLFDLLQETNHEKMIEANGNDHKLSNSQTPKSSQGSPYISGTSSVWSNEATPSKDKTGRTKNCCFPILSPSFSFNDRRKQKTSPVH